MPTNRRVSSRSILFGSAMLLLNLTQAKALENFWTGQVSTGWTFGGNWSLGHAPFLNELVHVDIASTPLSRPFRPVIIPDVPLGSSLFVGVGNGKNGILDQHAGSSTTLGNNFIVIGAAGGTGLFNLADTFTAGGTLTQFGRGFGIVNTTVLFVGGFDEGFQISAPGGTGKMNMNTSGALNLGKDLRVGSNGGTGVFNLDDGTISPLRDILIGAQAGFGAGALGTFNMSGGTINTLAGNRFIIGEGRASGVFNLTGGTIRSESEFSIGQGAGANGTMNVDGGSLRIDNPFTIGRDGGTGTLNLTGGEINKLNVGTVLVGGSAGAGRVNQSGGVFKTGNNSILLGQNLGSTALWDLSGGAVDTPSTVVGFEGGTAELRVRGTGFWLSPTIKVGVTTFNPKSIVRQSGGTIQASTSIAVGLGSALPSEYHITGGTTNALSFEAGATSSALVSVAASGVLNADNILEVPSGNGKGTLNIFGGTVNTARLAQGGRTGSNGVGITNQSGGTVNITGNLDVQRSGSGTYNLSGGILSVNGAINLASGTFNFSGGKITRSNPGTITFNGSLKTSSGAATFDLDNDKTFDVNGAFDKVAGITLELTGIVIPAWDGVGIDTASIKLGAVDSIIGTFNPATDTVSGLTISNPFTTTFISEQAGEGGLFDASQQSVFWVEENGGTVSLRYSLVPEPNCAWLLSGASALLGSLRRRRDVPR